MTEREIRKRLERYDKERARGVGWSVEHQPLGAFADWMAEELERQLDRNCNFVDAMKPVRYVVAHTESHVHDDVIVHTARLIGGNQYAYLELGHLRRLVETLLEGERK